MEEQSAADRPMQEPRRRCYNHPRHPERLADAASPGNLPGPARCQRADSARMWSQPATTKGPAE